MTQNGKWVQKSDSCWSIEVDVDVVLVLASPHHMCGLIVIDSVTVTFRRGVHSNAH